MKRLIALLLTLVLALSAGLIPAWAAEVPSDPTAIANPNAVGYSAANVLAYPTDGLTDIKDYDAATYASTAAYVISDEDGLVKFSQIVNGTNSYAAQTFEGKDVVLAKTLNMSGKDMYPIGYNVFTATSGQNNGGAQWAIVKEATYKFKGNFYGNGYEIKNYVPTSAAGGQGGYDSYTLGLFGVVDKAVIRDVQVTTGCSFIMNNRTGGHSMAGAIASVALMNTSIINCMSAASDIRASYAGGIVGRMGDSNIVAYCTNKTAVRGDNTVGGISAWAGAVTIQNCANNTGFGAGNPAWIGGLIGWAAGNIGINNTILQMNKIQSTSKSTNMYVGGLVGRVQGSFVVTATDTRIFSMGEISLTEDSGATVGDFISPRIGSSQFVGTRTYNLDGMLNISCQYVENAAGTEASLRVISALNGIEGYKEVGFQYKLNGGTTIKSKQIKTVFQTIYANDAEVVPGDHFGENANYFSTIVIDGIDSANYGTELCFRYYVVLEDGTYVMGSWSSPVSITSLKAAESSN